MNNYIKLAGYGFIGYIFLWGIYMAGMSLKIYFDYHGYPSITYFMKLFYGL